MLIRHTACFVLFAVLDHPVAVVLAALVAALVPVVGLAPRASPACLVLAVCLSAIASSADDKLAPAPPAHHPSRVRLHPLLAASAENFVRPSESCDDSPGTAREGLGLRPRASPFLWSLASRCTYRAGRGLGQFVAIVSTS
jgi:hypothetical protein